MPSWIAQSGPRKMERHLSLLQADVEEPWPWVFIFVLWGWAFFLIGSCLITGMCLTKLMQGTRYAMRVTGACSLCQSRTSCRTTGAPKGNIKASVGVQTAMCCPETEQGRGHSDLVSPSHGNRCLTPQRRECVYSTHPRQAGSPDLVKIMACRARPVVMDLAKGSKSASSEWENHRHGHH